MRWRILPLLFLLHCWTTGIGQTEKGSWLVDGELEVNPYAGFPVFQMEIKPTVGYFFMRNLVAGTETSFFHQQSKFNSTLKYTNYSVSPFVRYYFLKKKLRPYVQTKYIFDWYRRPALNLDFGGGSSFTSGHETKFQTAYSASLGINYLLPKNITLNAQFIYFFKDDRRDINQRQNEIFRGIQFGLTYFLSKSNQNHPTDSKPLVDRLLKKGNFQIGLNGMSNFKSGAIALPFWDIFLTKNLKLRNGFENSIARNVGPFDHYMYLGYQPELQLFIPINASTFFSPSIAGDVGIFHVKASDTVSEAFGWSLSSAPTLTHFRKNAIFAFGAEFRYFFHDRSRVESNRWDSDLFLKVTQFITPQLGISAEIRMTVLGTGEQYVFVEGNGNAPEFLRFGFQYFVEKR